jgi:AcrR family transcriptional regulator
MTGTTADAEAHLSRAEQARRTRERIVDGAAQLFQDRGYDATSLQQIADELGLAKAAVYYYFPTKADILRAIVLPEFEMLGQRLGQAGEAHDIGERRQLVAEAIVDALVAQRGMLRILRGERGVKDALAADIARFEAIRNSAVALLYGPEPSPDQRAAVYAVFALAGVVLQLADLAEPELRATLMRTSLRLLDAP